VENKDVDAEVEELLVGKRSRGTSDAEKGRLRRKEREFMLRAWFERGGV
jgi:hypothetical protein